MLSCLESFLFDVPRRCAAAPYRRAPPLSENVARSAPGTHGGAEPSRMRACPESVPSLSCAACDCACCVSPASCRHHGAHLRPAAFLVQRFQFRSRAEGLVRVAVSHRRYGAVSNDRGALHAHGSTSACGRTQYRISGFLRRGCARNLQPFVLMGGGCRAPDWAGPWRGCPGLRKQRLSRCLTGRAGKGRLFIHAAGAYSLRMAVVVAALGGSVLLAALLWPGAAVRAAAESARRMAGHGFPEGVE